MNVKCIFRAKLRCLEANYSVLDWVEIGFT